MKRVLLAGVALASLAACPASAGTTFLPWVSLSSEDGDESMMYLKKSGRGGTDSTYGSISGNGSHFKNDIEITSDQKFNAANGYATITPVSGNLDDLVLTPQAGVNVDGMFFRGQFNQRTTGTLVLTVLGNLGTTQTFKWNIATLTGGSDTDFSTIGFDEANGKTPEAIKSVTISFIDTSGQSGVGFKELKQVDWSGCNSGCLSQLPTTTASVPEPSTWVMLLLGFAGLGYVGYRRRRSAVGAAI
jgi:hypothetical protein